MKGGEGHHLLGVTVYFGALDQRVIVDSGIFIPGFSIIAMHCL